MNLLRKKSYSPWTVVHLDGFVTVITIIIFSVTNIALFDARLN